MYNVSVLIVLNISLALCNSDQQHSISKRALLFPRLTFLQFTYGLTVPLVLPRRSINLSACCQTNYDLPYNVSRLQPKIIPARNHDGIMGISRATFYEYIMRYLESFGLEGEDCLLRTICEIADTPMHIGKEDTLLEKIVHFVFTPSLEMYSDLKNLTTKNDLGFVEKLLLAETNGKNRNKCSEVYSDCLISIVDIFTAKYII